MGRGNQFHEWVMVVWTGVSAPPSCRPFRPPRSRIDCRRVLGMVSLGRPESRAPSPCFRQEFPGAAHAGIVTMLREDSFDANTPAPIARFLQGHDVVRADELGWQGLENGTLVDATEQSELDLLLSCDRNIQYQQNLAGRKLTLVILSSNHWPTLRRFAARIAAAVDFCANRTTC